MGFEAFAIVELMGHQRIAGKVSEETIAGAAMLRVDVPKTERREPYTKFYTAGAVYCITPTDEATATLAAQQFDQPPVSPYIVRMPENPLLAEKIGEDRYFEDYPDDDGGDDEDDDEYMDGGDDDYEAFIPDMGAPTDSEAPITSEEAAVVDDIIESERLRQRMKDDPNYIPF